MLFRSRKIAVALNAASPKNDGDVLGTVRALELELVALEEDVVEAPGLGSQDGRDSHLSALDLVREVDGAHARVAGGPTLARTRVGRVTESAQALAVDKDLRDDVDSLVAREAEHFRDDGGRREFDEDDVVQADAVERVLEGHAALDLVRLDHGAEDVLDDELLARAREVVSDGEDRAEVVGRVTPLGGEPACGKRTLSGLDHPDESAGWTRKGGDEQLQ